MLTIHDKLVEAMLTQARRDYPVEIGSVIAGPAGSNLPLRLISMRNSTRSPAFFDFDSEELARVCKQMEKRGEDAVP